MKQKRAERANKRKSIHLTVISHELRTPMNGVLGAIELLQTTPLNIEQQGLADTARNCTLSLLAIINNLLDFSRIESGHFTLHMEETALLPLLDQAMQTIQGQRKAKNCHYVLLSVNMSLSIFIPTVSVYGKFWLIYSGTR